MFCIVLYKLMYQCRPPVWCGCGWGTECVHSVSEVGMCRAGLGAGTLSHHPDDDMRGDQPTLCSHTQGWDRGRQHFQYHHDRQDSLSLHQGDNDTFKAENKYVSILKIAERLGNCVCKYNSNFTLFWFPDRKVTSVQIVESFRFLSFIFWSRTSENKM